MQLVAEGKLSVDTRLADVLPYFKLNVETFLASANAYDSLAEAYKEAGMKDLAVKDYAKALELDPSNRGAVEKLNELMKR